MNYSGSSLQKAFKDLQSKILNFQSFDNALGGICEKYWLISKNKRYLFKFPDRFLNSIEPKFDYSDFGEVFTSYLSYYLGFKCVKSVFYQGVFDDKSWGTLVEDFRNKNVVETVSLRLLKEKYKYDKVKYSCDAVFKICKFSCRRSCRNSSGSFYFAHRLGKRKRNNCPAFGKSTVKRICNADSGRSFAP